MLTTEIATAPIPSRSREPKPLPTYRLNLMRVGYLVMGVGLAVFRWPLLLQADSLPAAEGVIVVILTAMSLLAFLGLRHPVKMLPILVFESAWKLIWLALVALPYLLAGDVDGAKDKLLASILWVVIVLAVTPWDYVWKTYITARGDRWRRSA
jgi:hypothetical protein